MKRKRTRGEGGFTLLEVLIALVVLCVGIVGAAGLAVTTVQGNDAANKVTRATILAKDKIEEVRTAGYAAADAQAGTEAYGSISGDPAFRRVTTVTDDTPDVWMKTVSVTVEWASGGHTVALSTIITREWPL